MATQTKKPRVSQELFKIGHHPVTLVAEPGGFLRRNQWWIECDTAPRTLDGSVDLRYRPSPPTRYKGSELRTVVNVLRALAQNLPVVVEKLRPGTGGEVELHVVGRRVLIRPDWMMVDTPLGLWFFHEPRKVQDEISTVIHILQAVDELADRLLVQHGLAKPKQQSDPEAAVDGAEGQPLTKNKRKVN